MQKSKCGIIVAATHHIEWLLPWWWANYQAHNTLPVAFIDLGLSPAYKAWAQSRGRLLSLEIPNPLVFPKERVPRKLAETWQQVIGSGVWDVRLQWFKKPFAFASAPFAKNLWLDLDCEVRVDLSPLFALLTEEVELLLTPEPEALQKGFTQLNLAQEKLYNSGVVLFHKGASFLSLWGQEVIENNHLHIGDQEALSFLLAKNPIPFKELDPLWNWDRGLGPNSNAKIFHFHGQKGKILIEEQMNMLSLLGVFETP